MPAVVVAWLATMQTRCFCPSGGWNHYQYWLRLHRDGQTELAWVPRKYRNRTAASPNTNRTRRRLTLRYWRVDILPHTSVCHCIVVCCSLSSPLHFSSLSCEISRSLPAVSASASSTLPVASEAVFPVPYFCRTTWRLACLLVAWQRVACEVFHCFFNQVNINTLTKLK